MESAYASIIVVPRTVGIIGGMGPDAAAAFFQHLIQATPANRDQEHIPTLMISDPTIPDRTEYLCGRGESPLPKLLQIGRQLEELGAELVAIPCNTAHVFWRQIAESLSVPVLNIVDEAVRHLDNLGTARKIGILSTKGTIAARLYEEPLRSADYVPILPDSRLLEDVQDLIEAIKARYRDRGELSDRLEHLITELKERGAEGVILGCTELGLVKKSGAEEEVFDSLRILASATAEQAFL